MHRRFGLVLLLAVGMLRGAFADEAAAPPDYNRDVRPILSAHCFKCHGPDDKTREAGLRLDDREAATAASDSGAVAIVPARPEASELVRRILSTDESEAMPPAAANKPLSAKQKEILQRWIAAGAKYDPHWAFVPPKQLPPPLNDELPPAVRQEWPRQPIDCFILAGQQAAGLTPSTAADRYTLVRRVSFDLLGLPPTPEEADAFVADQSPDAYERLVDRLLASPHYGQRWARKWLDLARYADTNGYEKDRVRNMWPYRDWVISALNADMPFDQFTIEQLAGDMLPGATLDQRVATGFHRNTMINEEGGIDPLEYRFYAMVDRVSTTGTVWMGLTLGCAQCHTHKFDPIPHTDYYRQMALLNNADEPTIDVVQPDIAARRAEIEQQIAKMTSELSVRFPPEGELKWKVPTPRLFVTTGPGSEFRDDGSVLITGKIPESDLYSLHIELPAGTYAAMRVEALVDPSLPSNGPGRTPHGNFVVSEVRLHFAPEGDEEPVAVKLARAEADFAQDGFPAAHAIDGDVKTGWAIHGPGKWNVNRTLTMHFDKPLTLKEPRRFWVGIDQSFGMQHTLGCLRVSFAETASDDRPAEVRRQEHFSRKFEAWRAAEAAKTVKWTPLKPLAASSDVPTLTIEADGSIFVSGDMTKRDIYDLTFDTVGLEGITAIRLEAMTDERLPQRGPGRIYYEGPFGDFFLSEVTLSTPLSAREKRDGGERAGAGVTMKLASASHSFANANNTADKAIDGDPQTGWSINGGQGRPHSAVFVLDKPLAAAETMRLQLLFERYYAAGLGRFRIWATTDPRGGQARDFSNEVEELLLLPPEKLSPAQRQLLVDQFCQVAPELAAERETIKKLRDSMPAHPTTLVMQERPAGHPRATLLRHRGEFLQPRDAVEPGLLSVLATPAMEPVRNRLDYAQWLASEQNPLVGRVTMNRHWAALFGTGLVRTIEDFGYQGESPSHPALLDWLAVEFPRRGWSLKSMHRLMVTSSTYRQSSQVLPDHAAQDPQNRLLAHFPRTRLDGEMVRDSALRISGLLSEKIGGPSVFPVQPASVTTEGAYGSLGWNVSPGEDRYRRGLYTFAKRTAPFAMLATFDGPSGEACVARREVTNTPLQALTMLNDATLVEAAQVLGREIATLPLPPGEGRGEGVSTRVTFLFRRCLTRPPTSDELALLTKFHESQKQRLIAKELDAAAIAGTGDGEPIERAAWTLTARAILNLDEAITKE